jgi:acyl carrier protein
LVGNGATTRAMGMDGVEIVMEVEEAFDIRLDDAEAEKVFSPRQLIELVMSKIAQTSSSSCLKQRSFNLLRSFAIRHLPLKRADVAPAVKLSKLIPRAKRRDFLRQLAAELQTGQPPELIPPVWVKWALQVAGSIVLIPFVFLPAFFGGWGLIAMIVLAIAGGYAAAAIMKPSCTEFPDEIATVGGLARWIMTHKPNLAEKSESRWTRDQVAARIREIVIGTLACEKNYTEDARFIEDLGLS